MIAVNTPPGQILLVDKPLYWTSFAVVSYLKYQVKPLKIGHAGTLDPLATGLLILCTGKYTKNISDIQSLPKTYSGNFLLGYYSESYDLECPLEQGTNITISSEEVIAVSKEFTGTINQFPPVHSAIKIDGERSYDLARKGISIEAVARSVEIYSLNIQHLAENLYSFEVVCSKGTYIRSLIHDIGNRLGTQAVLTKLRREKIGTYDVSEAMVIDSEKVQRGQNIREKVYGFHDKEWIKKVGLES